jgi:hypothetical protein
MGLTGRVYTLTVKLIGNNGQEFNLIVGKDSHEIIFDGCKAWMKRATRPIFEDYA